MESFRKDSLIPLAVAAASVGAQAYLQIRSGYLITFVSSMVLVALFAGLPFHEPHKDDVPLSDSYRAGTHRPVAFTLAIIAFCLVALISGILGYIDGRTKASHGLPPSLGGNDSSPSLQKETPSPSTPEKAGSAETAGGASDIGRSDVDEFVRKYVDLGASSKKGLPRWAYAISDEDGSDLPELNEAIGEAIIESGNQRVALFRPLLMRDGRVQDLYDGDPVLMRKLGQFCDGIVAGKIVSSVLQAQTEGMLTIELSAHIRVISVPSGVIKREFPVLERGAGFSLQEGKGNARERAARSLKEQLKLGF
jgi:hypothetical protein